MATAGEKNVFFNASSSSAETRIVALIISEVKDVPPPPLLLLPLPPSSIPEFVPFELSDVSWHAKTKNDAVNISIRSFKYLFIFCLHIIYLI